MSRLVKSKKNLRKPTSQERLAYHKNGYVVVPDVFPLQILEEIDREIEKIPKVNRKCWLGVAIRFTVKSDPKILSG